MAWTQNRNQICTRALKECGLISTGNPANQNDMNDAADCLNAALEDMHNNGFAIMQVQEISSLILPSDKVIGYRCIRSHTSNALNQPGIGTHWTDFWYADSTSLSGAWTLATAYNCSADILLGTDTDQIIKASIRISGDDYPLEIVDYHRYDNITTKSTEGEPFSAYIDYGQVNPVMHLYYIPDLLQTYYIVYYKIAKIPSLDTPTSTTILPGNFFNALTYVTASHLADLKKLPLPERAYLTKKAENLMSMARGKEFKIIESNIAYGSYVYNK
jgi:hypothetical protein